jgi:hypothetical protein
MMKKLSKMKKIWVAILAVAAIAVLVAGEWIYHNAWSPGTSLIGNTTNNASSSASSTVSSTILSAISSTAPLPPVATPQPPAPPQDIGHVVGIAAGGGLSKISTSTLNAELDHMVALGITWVRFDIEWGDVQYSSSSTSASTWGAYDTLVNALVAHHLKGLGVIDFTPAWARAPGCTGGVECPPADPETFATFAAEVAARYAPDGMHYWEIWNEPNSFNFWATSVNCGAYTAVLKATYPAIKAADPNAVVITGGLAPESTNNVSMSPTDFLSCIYNDGGEGYFDAVGDHPYVFPEFPSSDSSGAWAQMSETTPSLRSIMVANGDANKKIWLTEFGAPTNGPDPNWYVSESTQAAQVTDAIDLYESYPWAGPIFWYTFQDSGTDASTNENFFGLVRADGSEKPAYSTMQSIIAGGL